MSEDETLKPRSLPDRINRFLELEISTKVFAFVARSLLMQAIGRIATLERENAELRQRVES